MPDLRRLSTADIKIGEPLRFSIYDQSGTLLLRKGITVSIQAQIDRLVEIGCYLDAAEVEPVRNRVIPPFVRDERPPTFLEAEELCSKLKNLFMQIYRIPEQTDVHGRTMEIAQAIQAACKRDANGLIAALHIESCIPYLIGQQMMGAVLLELTASHAGIGEVERLRLIAAALTRDLGMLEIQAELDKIGGPLPDSLRPRMQQHISRSIELLSKAKIHDRVWLETIAQHHEKMDGSGYSSGLSADRITAGARLLGICDIFSAMIKPRPYRQQGKAKLAQTALREIYAMGGKTLDPTYTGLLIKAIGVLPPGTVVKLKSGEVAIVKEPVTNPKAANVLTLYDRTEMPVIEPIQRDTSMPEYEITGLVPHEACRSAQLIIKRIWMKG